MACSSPIIVITTESGNSMETFDSCFKICNYIVDNSLYIPYVSRLLVKLLGLPSPGYLLVDKGGTILLETGFAIVLKANTKISLVLLRITSKQAMTKQKSSI